MTVYRLFSSFHRMRKMVGDRGCNSKKDPLPIQQPPRDESEWQKQHSKKQLRLVKMLGAIFTANMVTWLHIPNIVVVLAAAILGSGGVPTVVYTLLTSPIPFWDCHPCMHAVLSALLIPCTAQNDCLSGDWVLQKQTCGTCSLKEILYIVTDYILCRNFLTLQSRNSQLW